MKGYDLLKGMGHIDDSLVEEALTAEQSLREPVREPKRGFWERLAAWPARTRWVAAAACVAIAVFAGWGISQGGRGAMAPDMMPATAQKGTEEAIVAENETNEAAGISDEAEGTYGGVDDASVMLSAEPAEASLEEDSDTSYYALSTVIEDYPGNYADGCRSVPENGEVTLSTALQDAMAEYGDAVMYRVRVEIFRDGEMIPSDDPEQLLSFDELQTLTADDGCGWRLCLCGEEAEE